MNTAVANKHLATKDVRMAPQPAGAVAPHQSMSGTALVTALERAASNPALDMDKVERLFAMHSEIVKRDAEMAFNAALARAQSGIQPIVKNKTNSHTHSKYADLAAINEAIVPIYTAEGLSLSFDTKPCDTVGWVRIIGILSHSGGYSKSYELALPPDGAGLKGNSNKSDVQAAVSSISYGRRNLELLIFNIATFDEDGNKPKEKPIAGTAKSADGTPPAYPQEKFDENFAAWKQAVWDGQKTPERIIAKVGSKYLMTEDQIKAVKGLKANPKAK